MFHGSIVALVTPMFADGLIDKEAFAQLIEWHIESGTHAIVVAGTTGEAATLTLEEKHLLFRLALEVSANRIPIIAGTAENSTKMTIELTEMAAEVGVTAALIMTPAYIKPTQEGLFLHYKQIAEQVALPIILYNVPSRTACDLLPETIVRLAEISNIIGIKEATGKMERVESIIRQCGSDMDVYSGDDLTALEAMRLGARGVISVTANVVPAMMRQMTEAVFFHEIEKALQINEKLLGLHRDLFVEANPIPVKWVLHEMGRVPAGIRLPLTPLSHRYHETLRAAMYQAEIFK